MKNFFITVRLDTPLLQGGSKSGMTDPLGILRAESIRGLMHTWSRAIIAPLVGQQNIDILKKAEHNLFGYAAGERDDPDSINCPRSSGFATFRMHDLTQKPNEDLTSLTKMPLDSFPICPHNTRKGFRSGHPKDIERIVRFSFRRDALKNDPALTMALWTTLWTALAFGSLGQRARRGYGSLTLIKVEGLSESDLGGLTAFPAISDVNCLRQQLVNGFSQAQKNITEWLGYGGVKCIAKDRIQVNEHKFFQLADSGQIRVGSPDSISDDMSSGILYKLMRECSLNHGQNGYKDFLGNHSPRFASPLWVRIYRLNTGKYVPVTVYSSRQASIPTLVNSVVNSIGISY